LREKLGKCGQNIIMESLNWDNAAKELRQAYAQVLRGM